MDCQDVVERLPWFVNRTLDPVEDDAVRLHVRACDRCRSELDATRLAMRVHDTHVPSGALVAYAFDRPIDDGLDRATIKQHLEACDPCREELALVRESQRALHEIEGGQEREERHGTIVPASARRTRGSNMRVWLPSAAGLVLVAGVAGWLAAGRWAARGGGQGGIDRPITASAAEFAALRDQNRRLRENRSALEQDRGQARAEASKLAARVAELERPAPNVLAVDILPLELTQRAPAAGVNALVVPRDTASVTLILQAASPAAFAQYDVEMRRGGQVVWSAGGLVRHASGDYTISVPASFLEPGAYTITVFGVRNGSRVRTESYSLRVERR